MVDFSVASGVEISAVVTCLFSVVGIDVVVEGSSPSKIAEIKFDVLCTSVDVALAIDAVSVEVSTSSITVVALVTPGPLTRVVE